MNWADLSTPGSAEIAVHLLIVGGVALAFLAPLAYILSRAPRVMATFFGGLAFVLALLLWCDFVLLLGMVKLFSDPPTYEELVLVAVLYLPVGEARWAGGVLRVLLVALLWLATTLVAWSQVMF